MVKVPALLSVQSPTQNDTMRGWEKGFKLTWSGDSDCSTCEGNSGKCGFPSRDNQTQVCFCADGRLDPTCRTPDSRTSIPGCHSFECDDGRIFQYPFWLDEAGSKYCGYPGLGVSCDNGGVLSISGRKYYIKDIDYQKQSITLLDVNMKNYGCVNTIHPVKLESPSLSYGDDNFFTTFFFNCTSFSNSIKPITCQVERSIIKSYLPVSENFSYDTYYPCETILTIPLLQRALDKQDGSGSEKTLWEGFELSWSPDSNCWQCEASGGACGYYVDSARNFTCFCFDGHNYPQDCYNLTGFPTKIKILIGVSVSIGALVLVALILLNRSRLFLFGQSIFWMKKYRSARKVEKFLEDYGSSTPKRYRYAEIKKLTNFFKDKLGQGGYGAVFKGKLDDGRLVAVKVLSESKGNGEEFINEVASIGRTYHVNIVSLLGYCSEGSKRALVYEFMPNGSLERFIYGKRNRRKQVLSWAILYQIALGIARGLDYLHRGCITRILHFDIKPHNILLDEKFCPKISDFGLAKLCPTVESTISIPGTRGTFGYIAPEVYCRNIGGVSYKSDVYSYGMMVLEMVGGRKNLNPRVEKTSEIYFPHWIYKRVEQEEDLGLGKFNVATEEDTARKMVLVGLWCIQTDPSIRPSMSKVVEMLEGNCDSLQMPPKPYLESAST